MSHVQIPASIDRRQLTTATAPATLQVDGGVRWVGPLDGVIQIVLASDLASRLPHVTILMPGDPVPPGDAGQVLVTIPDFMPDQDGTVSLSADWSVTAPDGEKILRHGRFQATLPGDPQPGAAAQTMSAAIAQLADRIAGDP